MTRQDDVGLYRMETRCVRSRAEQSRPMDQCDGVIPPRTLARGGGQYLTKSRHTQPYPVWLWSLQSAPSKRQLDRWYTVDGREEAMERGVVKSHAG